MSEPVRRPADIADEAQRLVKAAEAEGLQLRLLGGVAIFLRTPDAMARPALRRAYQDIDLAAPKRQARPVRDFLTAQGYEANARFNALHGSSRLLFYDDEHSRQVDVFLGTFKMCHELDLERRLEAPGVTMSPSDLLLLKLQIVELNEKDIRDAIALFLQYAPVAADEPDQLSSGYISKLGASDWGWYTTLNDNLALVRKHVPSVLEAPEDIALVQGRIDSLVTAMENEPKGMGWRMRDRIGRRKAWYELPEEVAR